MSCLKNYYVATVMEEGHMLTSVFAVVFKYGTGLTIVAIFVL